MADYTELRDKIQEIIDEETYVVMPYSGTMGEYADDEPEVGGTNYAAARVTRLIEDMYGIN